jgi:hypothetical protein
MKTIVEKIFDPVREELEGISNSVEGLRPTAVFERYVELYMAMKAFAVVADTMFDILVQGMDDVARKVAKEDCDRIVRELATRYAREIFST